MLHRVVNVNKLRIEEKRQNFSVHVDHLIPASLLGDDQRLAQIITNLLGNSVKFTPEQGSIHIDTRFLEEENELCTIQVCVTDNGIGVSPEQQSKLFHSFQQAESGTTRKFGGTGLGLSISKTIVEMMGGKIWIESELGQGATFAFTFKAKRMPEKEIIHPAWDTIRILAADDDPLFLEEFSEIMHDFGASFGIAASAEEALDLSRQNGGYDVYFIDWRMPGMSGIELTETLKKEAAESGREIYVVIMSAVEWSIIEEEAKKAGVDIFLPKPLFPSDIVDTVNGFLGAPQQTESAPQTTDSFAGYRVLLAEDIEINREIVSALLEPTSLEIECAENGKEALEMFTTAPDKYDMILMDMQMPEMDGLEATRSIRALEIPRARTVPIVAMTANAFTEDIESCLAAGMNAHIKKPLNLEEVLNKLRTYLFSKKT
jgi:CheY-like chemotaxis protein